MRIAALSLPVSTSHGTVPATVDGAREEAAFVIDEAYDGSDGKGGQRTRLRFDITRNA